MASKLRKILTAFSWAAICCSCAEIEPAPESVFLSSHEGCTRDLWELEEFQHEFVVHGTTLEVALDEGVDVEEARALVAVIGDANRLLPTGIEPPKSLRLLICGEGATAYANTISENPVVVVPVRYKNADDTSDVKKTQAVLLHEYGHTVFAKFLSTKSQGYRRYKRQAQNYARALKDFEGVPPYDSEFLALRQRVWDLDIAKNRYYVRIGPFEELLADTLAVATLDDGKAMTHVFAEASASKHLEENARFRDFTLVNEARDTPFASHLAFAPARHAIWRNYGAGRDETWENGLSKVFSASLDELEAWANKATPLDHKDSVTLNRSFLKRLGIR